MAVVVEALPNSAARGAEQEEVRPGFRFGPDDDVYEVGEEVGSGAAARVYTCQRLRTGDQLAVKVINLQRLQLMGDVESQVVKLNREVQILQGLRHEKIVNLCIVHKTEKWLFLVMELVRGGELFYQIVQHRSLTDLEARYVFRQLLEAIGYMHSMRVIHRDLKPENILIVRTLPAAPPMSGNLHDVKIADFGLSKIISEGTSFARTFVGTSQYWAPEVLDAQTGDTMYDQSADFWSLGVVLFVMLCGRYPFVGKKQPLEEQIRAAAFNMNTARWQNISEEAKDLVRGLLLVDPRKRMTLEDCLKHPWVLGHASLQLMPGRLPTNAVPAPAKSDEAACSGLEVTGATRVDSSTTGKVVQQPSVTSVESAQSVSTAGKSATQATVGPQPKSNSLRTHQKVPSIQVEDKMESDIDQAKIFCLNELLKLQVSIAGSLEMAFLAFRHADKELAEAIQHCIWQNRDLSQHAANIVSRYADVAHHVADEVLPDLTLAVQEKEPALAVNFLNNIKDLVVDMKKQGEDMQRRYAQLQDGVHSLIIRAMRTKNDADRRLAEAMQAVDVGAPSSPRIAALDSPPSPRSLPLAIASSGCEPTAIDDEVQMAPAMPEGPAAPLGPHTATPAVGGGMEPGLTPSLPLNVFTRQLFEQLHQLATVVAPSKSSVDVPMLGTADMDATTPSPGDAVMTDLEAEAWKRDVLELLFLAPGITPTALPKLETFKFAPETLAGGSPEIGKMNVDISEDVGGIAEGLAPGSQEREIQVPHDAIVRYGVQAETMKTGAQAASRTSASLLRALRELKRVDEILQGCSAFWQNMDGTVQKLAQMKEHTECLVNFAANSARLRERFEQRLGEYTTFWASLEHLCRQYVVDHQAAAKRMYQCIREVSDASEILDTAESAMGARMGPRMGMFLAR